MSCRASLRMSERTCTAPAWRVRDAFDLGQVALSALTRTPEIVRAAARLLTKELLTVGGR
jgi:hypothetical protein